MRAQPETAAVAVAAPGTLEWLAGYRVLRRLGSGSRATVYLAHAGGGGDGGDGGSAGSAGSAGPPVAIKVFEPFVSAESLDAEIDALSSVTSLHVVRMLDIAIAPGRPRCIVLQRLAGGSLAARLARGPALTAGAAVTVLVCVARGLDALRSAGFTHERLSPTTVLFDEDGCPVLTGLGHAVPTANAGTVGPTALARLIRTVFDHVDDPTAARRAEELSRWLEETETRGLAAAAIEDRLFELAEPEPVLQVAEPQPDRAEEPRNGHEPVPARAVVGGQRPQAEGASLRARAAPRTAAHVARLDTAPWWLRGAELTEALRRRVRQRKRPLVVAGVVGGALLVLALTLLPGNGRSAATATPTDAPERTPSASSAPAAVGAAPKHSPRASPAAAAAIGGSDPVAATMALLAQRRTCLQTRAPACLEAVDQDGSPMLDADRSLIASGLAAQAAQAGQQPGRPSHTYEGYDASLIQRSGGSALIALAPPGAGGAGTPKPASALVIEGETGWRLREVFAD